MRTVLPVGAACVQHKIYKATLDVYSESIIRVDPNQQAKQTTDR